MTEGGRKTRVRGRRGRLWPAMVLAVAAVAAAGGALVLAFDESGALSSVPPTVTSVTVFNETSTSRSTTYSSTTAGVVPGGGAEHEEMSVSTTIPTNPVAEPLRIVIPAIGVDSGLIAVGLKDDGDMEVPPFGTAGWYELGPVPGAAGPAVIVAHVDTKTGPDVFYRLDELRSGDQFVVYGADGATARFVVDGSEIVLKRELPSERIWISSDQPLIRLITCGGEFDRSSRHYLSNVIVYGRLIQ